MVVLVDPVGHGCLVGLAAVVDQLALLELVLEVLGPEENHLVLVSQLLADVGVVAVAERDVLAQLVGHLGERLHVVGAGGAESKNDNLALATK